MAAVELQFRKITFTSCCDPNDVLEFKYSGGSYPSLVYPNPSLPLPAGFSNTCYQVTTTTIPLSEWSPLPSVTSFPPSFFSSFANKEADCEDYVFPEGCPECKQQCYTLYNCEGESFSTTNDLSFYATSGQPITLYNEDGVIPGTWYVFETEGSCPVVNNEFEVEDVAPAECECRCFELALTTSIGSITGIQYIDCDNQLITNSTATKFCSKIYPIIKGKDYQVIEGDECIDNLCPEKCFKLTNCNTQEVIYSTLQTLSQYVNTSSVVSLLGYKGCWEVEESIATNCDCITVTIEADEGGGLTSITEHTATNIGTYNGWGVWQFTIDGDNFFIWNNDTNPNSEWSISINECCAGAQLNEIYAQSKFSGDCPEIISDGSLTGWVIQDRTPWINIQTEVCPGLCDCPVNITVLQEFDSCETCEPIVAYKLQNCEKIYDVQYTLQDLSEYINSVIETDCGCFTVQKINYVPPSQTLIVIDNTFKRCNDCLSKFYKLTDCSDPNNIIYTHTDLSSFTPLPVIGCDCISVTYTLVGDYQPVTVSLIKDGLFSYLLEIDGVDYSILLNVSFWNVTNITTGILQAILSEDTSCPFGTYTIEEGSIFESFEVAPCDSIPVIKIKGCDTCWEVTETRVFETLSNVVVSEEFVSCVECGIDLPCVCSKITNLTLTEQVVEYVDCEDLTQEITLEVGETSEKICLKKWILPELPEGQFLYPEYFGDCQNGVCPHPVFINNRTVRPGYNTPACRPDKYDEITCRFADIMYKVVLEKRYGITNCCPDEDHRWLVQKELIDLQALKDPNYNCPDCPCSCNSGKTCSTCNCKK